MAATKDDLSGDERVHDIVIRWTFDSVETLINIRDRYSFHFSGKRGTAQTGWLRVAEEMGFENPEMVTKQIAKKWANLQQKYKDIKYPPSGKGPEDGDYVTTTWAHFASMDKFNMEKGFCKPPNLNVLDSSKLPHVKYLARDCSVTNSEMEMQYDDYGESREPPEQHILPVITTTHNNTHRVTSTKAPLYMYKYKYKYKYKNKRKNKHKLPVTNYAPSTSSHSSSQSESQTYNPVTPVRTYQSRPEENRRKSDASIKSATKIRKDIPPQSLLIINQGDIHSTDMQGD